MAKCHEQGRARSLSLVKPSCPTCQDAGVLRLVAHWTGLDIGPAVVQCPTCHYPYVAIHTYAQKKAS